jgi:hypothetical protein
MRDEHYIIDLCDEVLGMKAERQRRFDFLRGDGNPGRRLPVDAYYPTLNLVIEYREKQHGEPVEFWDKRPTISGISRGRQRLKYDSRRRRVLPRHGIALVELPYADFEHGAGKRLRRNSDRDKKVLRDRLSKWIAMKKHCPTPRAAGGRRSRVD